MLDPDTIEQMLDRVGRMDRPALVTALRDIPCPFPIDFSDTYLATLPVDRLRHLLVAVCLHTRQLPSSMRVA